jgi:hypothetical protein
MPVSICCYLPFQKRCCLRECLLRAYETNTSVSSYILFYFISFFCFFQPNEEIQPLIYKVRTLSIKLPAKPRSPRWCHNIIRSNAKLGKQRILHIGLSVFLFRYYSSVVLYISSLSLFTTKFCDCARNGFLNQTSHKDCAYHHSTRGISGFLSEIHFFQREEHFFKLLNPVIYTNCRSSPCDKVADM